MPKDPIANLNFREELVKLGCADQEAARDLWIMCARDPLLWLNFACFTYDPRPKFGRPKIIPMITWEFQDEALYEILDAIDGGYDLGIEKSRDMGATWLILYAYAWLWQFREDNSFLLMSRKAELVWKSDDPKALFWKLEFILKHQPEWLKPTFEAQENHLGNPAMNNSTDGETTTGDASQGDRRTSIMLDELSRVPPGEDTKIVEGTSDASDCVIFNSTPNGAANAFHAKITQPGLRKLRLHWSLHPDKNKGLYTSVNGLVKILDKAYAFPPDYQFVTAGDLFFGDSKPRSPWFDRECKRRGSRKSVAQMLEIDYQAADSQFFDAPVLERLIVEAAPPLVRGEIEFDLDSGEFLSFRVDPKGKVLLWTHLDGRGLPPKDDYAAGSDISTGQGASNSTLSIGRRRTGEKYLEIATPHMLPEKFARLVVAACQMFSNKDGEPAFLIWEANGGPGLSFGNSMVNLGFKNFYYRQNERSAARKQTDVPGWWSDPGTKVALMTEYRDALARGDFTNKSKDALDEARYYIHHLGSVEHSAAISTDDPSGARTNHGDRVIADALCWKGCKDFHAVVKQEEEERLEHVNTFAARREKHEAKKREREEAWA